MIHSNNTTRWFGNAKGLEN